MTTENLISPKGDGARMKAILVLMASISFALSPFLVADFNGFAADQFPVPQIDPPVQPAGYAFAIWSVIYLWLIVGAGYGLLKKAEEPAWDAMRWPLFASLVVGTAWLSVAQTSAVWATVMIWVMLASAVGALLRAGRRNRWLLQAPIGLYAGWLTAASCVSIGLMLAGYGVLEETAAALVALVLALFIGATVLRLRGDAISYAGGVIWALVGVLVANTDPINAPVLGLTSAGILGIALLAWRGRSA